MALKIYSDKEGKNKTYATLYEIKIHRPEGKKPYANFRAAFNSQYKDKNDEWIKEDPLFVNSGVSFSEDVINALEGKEKAFGLISGKIYTQSYEKDGEKLSMLKLQINFFTEVTKSDKSADIADTAYDEENVPF